MKKMIALVLALMMLGLSCCALADDVLPIGQLSFLNMTEQENVLLSDSRSPAIHMLFLQGVLTDEGGLGRHIPDVRYYDTLDAMLMALQAGDVKAINVPYYTGEYLCLVNDAVKLSAEYHPEKLSDVSRRSLSVISDGYSFMLKEGNAELRDELDAQITAMKEDGTMQKLIDEHIVKVAKGEKPVAIEFEKFEGDPLRIAVTGSLPPMDYVSADGTFAGFNTAVLAEIGKRLQKNIELVQVDSIGRALALSEGTVDVVFWTRGMSEVMSARRNASEAEREAEKKALDEQLTDEEKAVLAERKQPDDETREKINNRDMPEGTIITQAYFSDFPMLLILK